MSLFGGGAAPSGGGLFGGAAPAANSGGGLFGGAAPAASSGGGLFGGAAPAAAAANSGGGLFGGAAPAAAAANSGGGLFGGAAPAAAAASTGGGLFGGAAPATTAATAGGGLFGAQPAAAATGGAATGLGALGGAASGVQGAQNNQELQRVCMDFQERTKNLFTVLQRSCIAYSYSVANTQQELVQHLQQPFTPQVHLDQQKWQHARDTNPDPNSCYPVVLQGMQQLEKRVQGQAELMKKHKEILGQVETELKNLKNRLQAHSLAQLEKCKQTHRRLQRQLVNVMVELEAHAIHAQPNSAARRDYQREQVLDQGYQELVQQLARPGCFNARIQELSYAVKALLHRLEANKGPGAGSAGRSISSDDLDAQRVLQVTDQQGEFLQILQEELRANHEDVNQMEAVLHRGQLGASINSHVSTGLGGTQIN